MVTKLYFLFRWYHFAVSCNDQCVLYHGESESTKVKIIDHSTYGYHTAAFDFEK